MSGIERHIGDALREVAEEITADSVPPLRLPGSRLGRGGSWRNRRFARLEQSGRWLAPAAAAAAIVLVAAGVAVVGHGRGKVPPPAGSGPHSTASCRGSGPASDAVPAYYIAETGTREPYPQHVFDAGIFTTTTGRSQASFSATGISQSVVDVSAAVDDHTFAIASQQGQPGTTSSRSSTTFSMIHYSPQGQAGISGIAMPPVPAAATFEGLALSPDGSRLAVAFQPPGRAITGVIRVLTIATRAIRTWTGRPGSVEGDTADPLTLSWSADSTVLAFNWYGPAHVAGNPVPYPMTGLRLLDTTAPGRNLVANSRLALHYTFRDHNAATSAGYLSDIAMLTPDCQTIVAAVTSFDDKEGGFAEFSAATGHFERKLGWSPMGTDRIGGPMDVLWSSGNGSTLVVYAPPGHANRIGIIKAGRLRLLPQPPRAQFPGATW